MRTEKHTPTVAVPGECPFCGSEARVSNTIDGMCYVFCTKNWCKNPTINAKTRSAAIAKWNLHKKEEA